MKKILCLIGPLVLIACPVLANEEQRLGARFEVRAEDLPKPYATDSASRSPRKIARPDGATLQVPAGFKVNIFRDNLLGPRWLKVAANGDVILAETRADQVRILRDRDGDGIAEFSSVFSDEIDSPHGLELLKGWLYVSDPTTVWRYRYLPGQTVRDRDRQRVTAKGALGDGGGHSTRSLALSPDGKDLYIAVGSEGNVGEEELPRASVQKLNLKSGVMTTFADGLRNAVGIAFHPDNKALFVTVNERDGFGEELVPDYLTRIEEGDFFGWPYAYSGMLPAPKYGAKRPDLVAKSKRPDVLFRSHSAPIGLAFYTGERFPPDYHGDAFVAFRGSWNAAKPRGYKIVRIRFNNGVPENAYENFAVGFWQSGDGPAQVWGRPAGLVIAQDGSLLIADDTGGVIWRISYEGNGN
jgi:glucose/arabinose dehydrogenase